MTLLERRVHTRTLPAGANALALVTSGSKAAGPLYSWALAQLEHAAALQLAAPLLAELVELDSEIGRLRARKRASDRRLAALRGELVELQVEEATLQTELADAPQWAATAEPTPPADAVSAGAAPVAVAVLRAVCGPSW